MRIVPLRCIPLHFDASRSEDLRLNPVGRAPAPKGMRVVEFKDNRGVSYMGLNGATTNGTLTMQIRDLDSMLVLAKAEGWPSATSSSAFPITKSGTSN